MEFLIFCLVVFIVVKFILNGGSFQKRVICYEEIANNDLDNCDNKISEINGEATGTDYSNWIYGFDDDDENPWNKSIRNHPLYGTLPANTTAIMERVSADPEEKILATIWTTKDIWKTGYLIATTRCIRWVQVFPIKGDDFWLYDTRVTIGPRTSRTFYPLVIDGNVFEPRGISNIGATRKFKKLCESIQQAIIHDSNVVEQIARNQIITKESKQKNVNTQNDISEKLEKLATSHAKGHITDEEYQRAKAKLLDI